MCIIASGLLFGAIGFGYGLWRGPDADYSSWTWAFREFKITDKWSFVRVAYIHNAGYLGGLVGLVVALVAIRPNRDPLSDSNTDGTNEVVDRRGRQRLIRHFSAISLLKTLPFCLSE